MIGKAGAQESEGGWVPIEVIEVGMLEEGRKFGDWKVQMSTPSPGVDVPVSVAGAGQGQLLRAMTTLWRVMLKGKIELGLDFLPDFFWKQMGSSGERIDEFTRTMMQAFVQVDPRILGTFDRPNFTIHDIRTSGRAVEDFRDGSGIYIIVYWDIDGEPDTAIYAGTLFMVESATRNIGKPRNLKDVGHATTTLREERDSVHFVSLLCFPI